MRHALRLIFVIATITILTLLKKLSSINSKKPLYLTLKTINYSLDSKVPNPNSSNFNILKRIPSAIQLSNQAAYLIVKVQANHNPHLDLYSFKNQPLTINSLFTLPEPLKLQTRIINISPSPPPNKKIPPIRIILNNPLSSPNSVNLTLEPYSQENNVFYIDPETPLIPGLPIDYLSSTGNFKKYYLQQVKPLSKIERTTTNH